MPFFHFELSRAFPENSSDAAGKRVQLPPAGGAASAVAFIPPIRSSAVHPAAAFFNIAFFPFFIFIPPFFHTIPNLTALLSTFSQPFTPEATMLCFSCFENRMESRITGVIVTTASPISAFCFVPALLEIL